MKIHFFKNDEGKTSIFHDRRFKQMFSDLKRIQKEFGEMKKDIDNEDKSFIHLKQPNFRQLQLLEYSYKNIIEYVNLKLINSVYEINNKNVEENIRSHYLLLKKLNHLNKQMGVDLLYQIKSDNDVVNISNLTISIPINEYKYNYETKSYFTSITDKTQLYEINNDGTITKGKIIETKNLYNKDFTIDEKKYKSVFNISEEENRMLEEHFDKNNKRGNSINIIASFFIFPEQIKNINICNKDININHKNTSKLESEFERYKLNLERVLKKEQNLRIQLTDEGTHHKMNYFFNYRDPKTNVDCSVELNDEILSKFKNNLLHINTEKWSDKGKDFLNKLLNTVYKHSGTFILDKKEDKFFLTLLQSTLYKYPEIKEKVLTDISKVLLKEFSTENITGISVKKNFF